MSLDFCIVPLNEQKSDFDENSVQQRIGGQNIETEISRDKISRDINIEVKNIEGVIISRDINIESTFLSR